MNDLVHVLSPQAARRHLVKRLQAAGRITSERVAAAFNAVPRHEFVPAGTSVQDAYADDVVITQRGSDGRTSSSISAPWLQAYMPAAHDDDHRPNAREPADARDHSRELRLREVDRRRALDP